MTPQERTSKQLDKMVTIGTPLLWILAGVMAYEEILRWAQV